jgi:hypothetical protein
MWSLLKLGQLEMTVQATANGWDVPKPKRISIHFKENLPPDQERLCPRLPLEANIHNTKLNVFYSMALSKQKYYNNYHKHLL